ncbi:alkaline shock response membrane anchor protein AmaP [Microbacterium sp. P26]|uniref:alkaline shock response membrane anchor protein AmaP n=1 Tax=Microbacterium TaxID=33882 RepID=UPI00203F2F87|nr:alkaline shock response membrane anchor protein AmaP [Microbacterium sp. P26]MCM3501072.1 alkaline shock response membrane anchor protein AmaP [Microbacterium sp. P26]
MTTVTASPGVGNRTAVAGPGLPAGRVNIADRVLQKTAERAAADVVGVDAKNVHVEIVSSRDTAVVRVSTAFPVPRLDDTEAVRAATPVLDAARAAQSELRTRLTRLFGREVSRVDLTITGASAPQRKRVL